MLVSYNWLQDFLNLDQEPHALAEKITRTGVEIADVKHPEEGLKKLVVGKVLDCKGVEGTHLHLTHVDVGEDKPLQIVCGAPNIAQGQKVVVALPGTLMPNGQQIWPGELRGVDSYGMICSARELGLPHAPQKRGIMVVPDNFEVGAEFEPTKCDELIASGEITL